ncbi:MAG: sialate O-acetylesterase [Planctomycetes bacterium]|nr:sialate O-acetylesterase [Planctomycetota bacterium]
MKRFATLLLLAGVSCLLSDEVSAEVKLPTVIDSHMVLQRDAPLPIWGWADGGEEVTVTIGENSATAKADAGGKWSVKLPAMKADGKAHTLTVAGSNTITLEDILIGEVWVGSGQSNMEWQLRSTHGSAKAIKAADFKNIRLFHVPKIQKPAPADNVKADWKVCTPENIPAFSAVLYYYGKKLHEELDVPVGLINSSWGGSPIEPWTASNGKGAGMYNGMIAPLQPFAVRGAIWYQGETNVLRKNGLAYYDRMKALIEGWRETWPQKELPFYFVQIAPWSGRYETGQLPALWEAQTKSLKIPATGMAVITDLVDNIADIHPRNKLDVGNRLARWALAKTYGKEDVVYSGPLYKSIKVEGGKAHLSFAHGKGLSTRDGKSPTEFQVAGADGKFVPATAEIKGETVIISAEGVAEPKTVRFGWHKVANPNLVNGAGLPASPFQTDNWSGGTGE